MVMKKIHRQPGADDERAADQPCRGGTDATKCAPDPRPTPIEGSATIVIVPSRRTMKNALHKSASARPRRRRSRTADATRLADADDSMVSLPGSFPAAAARSGGRIVGAVGSADTAAPGNWAPASRPVRAPGGVYTGRRHAVVPKEGARDGDRRSALAGAGRGWRGVPGAGRVTGGSCRAAHGAGRATHRLRYIARFLHP